MAPPHCILSVLQGRHLIWEIVTLYCTYIKYQNSNINDKWSEQSAWPDQGALKLHILCPSRDLFTTRWKKKEFKRFMQIFHTIVEHLKYKENLKKYKGNWTI